MDIYAVFSQLNDLPGTFLPQGAPYTQFAASVGAALAGFTAAADATASQSLAFSNALDDWIDVWGLLFGVPRNQNEGNIPYAVRIGETVLAWVGTLPALQAWVALFAPGGSVTENASGLGYVITLPSSMTTAAIVAFIRSLVRIRPAGVPFLVNQTGLGMFLGTEAFLGAGQDLGSYLTGGVQPAALGLNATTCSSQPLIPAILLQDPYLNPGLT
jgi:hypothetical protein